MEAPVIARSDEIHYRDVVSLFEEIVACSPESIAIESGDVRFSYRQLNNRANQVARYLTDLGAANHPFIGICANRSFEMIAGILGIIKTGAAYVPVDPDFPLPRIQYILGDTAVSVTLTSSTIGPTILEQLVRPVFLDEINAPDTKSESNLSVEIRATSSVYVMYTSGTTGQPKGVAIPHTGLARLLRNTNYIQINSSDVILHHATCSFDAGVFEMWAALLNGATLVLYPPQIFDLRILENTIRQHGITTLLLTTSLFHFVAEHKPECLATLRQLVVGGDVLHSNAVRKLLARFPHLTMINGYGPTENGVFTCCHVMHHETPIGDSVPIGVPISGTNVVVLDEDLHCVEAGQVGELYTNGLGMANGYIHSVDLTRERFIPSPFPELGPILYKTGDLARSDASGIFYFVGRADTQVKIRGFRVEPGEIEHVINLMSEVEESVVLVEQEGASEKYLVAYVKMSVSGASLDARAIKEHLASTLPSYMIPAYIHVIEEFPMTPNGKLDKKLLPEMARHREKSAARQSDFISDFLELVLRVWRERLPAPELNEYESVFEYGASSLTLSAVHSELNRHFSCFVSPADLLGAKTPMEWACVYARQWDLPHRNFKNNGDVVIGGNFHIS